MTLGLAGASLLFGFGCQVGEPPASTPTPGGLTIFTADRATGLTGMYKEGDQVVFFETITDPADEPGDHRLDHDEVVTRPMFSSRWSDAEGRTVSVHLSGSIAATTAWTDVSPEHDKLPDQWDVTLDLATKAGRALEAQGLGPDVGDEQAQLVGMVKEIPAAADRVLLATDEQLAQIDARQTTARGYLGYSWFQQFWVNERFFHQCTGWDNYRYYSGAWHYYNSATQDNGATCDVLKCGKVSSYVQDYKGWLDQCDGGSSTHYAVCDGQHHKYNCRSSALREQSWVLGNVWCSGSSQNNTTMCQWEEDNFGGAYCGFHSSCNNVNHCD